MKREEFVERVRRAAEAAKLPHDITDRLVSTVEDPSNKTFLVGTFASSIDGEPCGCPLTKAQLFVAWPAGRNVGGFTDIRLISKLDAGLPVRDPGMVFAGLFDSSIDPCEAERDEDTGVEYVVLED